MSVICSSLPAFPWSSSFCNHAEWALSWKTKLPCKGWTKHTAERESGETDYKQNKTKQQLCLFFLEVQRMEALLCYLSCMDKVCLRNNKYLKLDILVKNSVILTFSFEWAPYYGCDEAVVKTVYFQVAHRHREAC